MPTINGATISVTQGSIGTKTNRLNLLTYIITTDGTMSAITEKVNGVTIGTKNAASGQPIIAGLTQEQWDAIKFGKYKDATGGLNTLTIEMGTDIWTYTFDKRLATDADILSTVKAAQDSQNTFLPNIKKQLVDKVGGSTSDNFENIIKNITLGKKWASGIGGTLTTSGMSFTSDDGLNLNFNRFEVSGLAFTPSLVLIWNGSGATSTGSKITTVLFPENLGTSQTRIIASIANNNEGYMDDASDPLRLSGSAYAVYGGFGLPVYSGISPTTSKWFAFE